jgi:hypothetical protein
VLLNWQMTISRKEIPNRIWGQMGISGKSYKRVNKISKETDFRKQCAQ